MIKAIADRRGVISIISIGILALLTIFSLIIANVVNHTFNSVQGTNNYYKARDLASSVLEFLEAEAANFDAGYDTGQVRCEFNGAADNGNADAAAPHVLCEQISQLIGDQPATIEFSIDGRSAADQWLATEECEWSRFGANCYVVPFPGQGSAGSKQNCFLYEPGLGLQGQAQVAPDLTGLQNSIDQLEYSCNWNKLEFGSSLTDRAAIPLFYDNGDRIINPFYHNPANPDANPPERAREFTLRMRTPCDCEPDENGIPPVGCSSSDPTVCTRNRRPALFEPENPQEILVAWQITGNCDLDEGGTEECGVVQYDSGGVSSVINAIKMNVAEFRTVLSFSNDFGLNTSGNNRVAIRDFVEHLNSPLLTLFLNDKLISADGENIPYLEYQVLTDQPIGNNKINLNVKVNIDKSVYTTQKEIVIRQALIDFAVQN